MSHKVLSKEYINRHRFFTARKDSYETPDGKIVDPYYVVELQTSVAAMAVTVENEVILIRQYRYPADKVLLEIPGGFIDEGELPLQAIVRELLEETGYSFSSVHYLGNTFANPGVLNNITHLYLALGGKLTAKQSLDDNEEIEIMLKPLAEVKEMLLHNEIKQSMHALCMFHSFEYMKVNNLF